jgi:segregation and condensation protein B
MSQELNLIEQAIEKVSKHAFSNRDQEIKRIIEALLFSSSEAISLDKLREVINSSYPVKSREVAKLLEELSQEYKRESRAFQIDEIAGGYLLRTAPYMRPYVELLYQDRRGEKLSQAATEVLAVVAFRSPITRREIEKIRGVDCSGTIASLLERGLIELVGRKETPGRPVQYGVTKQFLQHFGLKDLKAFTVLESAV